MLMHMCFVELPFKIILANLSPLFLYSTQRKILKYPKSAWECEMNWSYG